MATKISKNLISGNLDNNFVSNGDAESGTTGWGSYFNTPGVRPTTGSGSVATQIALATTSVNPLSGTASFQVTKQAAAAQGEGLNYPFSVDIGNQARMQEISFDYKFVSGTFTAGSMTDMTSAGDSDLTVWVYDVTNNLLIQPSTYRLYSNSSTTSSKFSAYFQTAFNSTSYRLILHLGTTNSNAFVMLADNFKVSPTTLTRGSVITDWQPYTPTSTWVSNTTHSGKWRRVGSVMEVKTESNCTGAPTATPYLISIPAGYSIDSNITLINADKSPVGVGTILDTGNTLYPATTVAVISSTQVRVQVGAANATYLFNQDITATVPFSFGSGDGVCASFSVPITGWSSSTVMSSEGSQRAVAFDMSATNTPQNINNSTTTKFVNWEPTVRIDTHGGWDAANSRWIVPVPGLYEVTVNTFFADSTAAGVRQVLPYKNGNAFAEFSATGSTAGSKVVSGTRLVTAVAGDYIEMFVNQNSGGTVGVGYSQPTFMSIRRISGPEQIAATDNVAAWGRNTAGTSIANVTWVTIVTPTIVDSSHGTLTTAGVFTCPAAGRYFVCGTVNFAPNTTGSRGVRFRRNGGDTGIGALRGPTPSPHGSFIHGSGYVTCMAGDIIEMQGYQDSGGALALGASGDINTFFQVMRIGL